MKVTLDIKEKCVKMKKQNTPINEIYNYYKYVTKSTTEIDSFKRTLRKWANQIEVDNTPIQTDRLWLLDEIDKPVNRVVGVIGDTHFPFEHKNYLQFLIDTFIKYKVTDIVHIGDAVDNHVSSRHKTELDALSGDEEFYKAYESWQRYIKVFPSMYLCWGSHDKIPKRQSKESGLVRHFIKSYHQSWDLPETIKVVDSIIINNVKYYHGFRFGVNAARQAADDNLMSTVQGHAHSSVGIFYRATNEKMIYGMVVGTGISYDEKLAYAFRYNKPLPKKPIMSCGIVVSDTEAYVIPMSKNYFRSE